MLPRVFIGSSTEALPVAQAVRNGLARETLCKVWCDGSFQLSQGAVDSLMQEVVRSDFGVFVLSGGDRAIIRETLFQVPRDNVVFELGMFCGALGVNRSFFLLPQGSAIHIPTDLIGLTPGDYNPLWPEYEQDAAVATFVSKIQQKVRQLGFRQKAVHRKLWDLFVEYESCEFIKEISARLAEKERVWKDMIEFCRITGVSKRALAEEGRTGAYVALAAAIVVKPELTDCRLIRDLHRNHLAFGDAQSRMLQAMKALKDAGLADAEEKSRLADFALRFVPKYPEFQAQIAEFRR